jgi:transcriptional regulator of arginine metabolism
VERYSTAVQPAAQPQRTTQTNAANPPPSKQSPPTAKSPQPNIFNKKRERVFLMRSLRQSKILELISKNAVETQEELVDALRRSNFEVTQATVSRDIKELGLIKITSDDNKYKYAYIKSDEQKISSRLVNMFRESVISVEPVSNLIVLKTLGGSANAAGLVIDKLNSSEILGCIAGDDTVLLITKTSESAGRVINILKDLIK